MAETTKANNPFPGLRPFDVSENHLFFGRDEQSQELLRKLRQNRFVAVVGVSGSGKSSLVRAGLLPALHGGFMAQAGSRWRVTVFRPGHDPIGNMARALNTPGVLGETKLETFDQATIIETTLQRSDLGLVEATRQARIPSDENLLIVVDQFEELFRFEQALESEKSSDQASAFVTLLLEAAKSKAHPIYIVLTMRSDFLGDCSRFRDLPEAINVGQYLVPRMTRAQRQAAITGPVAVGGGKITPRLTQRLLNDVGDNPDQLPILQHALMRTWDQWGETRKDDEPIDLDHYEQIGGMDHALSHHADEAFQELTDEHSQWLAMKLFKTLSERGPDNREVRRPTRLGQLCAIAETNEKEMLGVIDAFRRQGRCFLMPPLGDALTQETLIDVSHESLIRNWDLLKTWVDEEVQSELVYRRLVQTALLKKEGKAGLWRDPDLQLALNWRENTTPNKYWARQYHPQFDMAIKFLEESEAKRDTEKAEEEAARQRELEQAQALAREQSKTAKTLRLVLALLSVLLVASVLMIVAFMQRRIAVRDAGLAEVRQLTAEQEKMQSDSAAVAFASLYSEADSLQRIAMLSAQAERMVRLEIEQQRQMAIAARDSARIERRRAEAQARLAERSKNEAIAVALAVKSLRLQEQGYDTLGALLAIESFRFDELTEGQFRNEVYDALRKALNLLDPDRGGPFVFRGPVDIGTSAIYDPERNDLAIGGADGSVYLVDLEKPDESRLLGKHQGMVTTTDFGHSSTLLASSGNDYTLKVWELHSQSGQAAYERAYTKAISSVAITPIGLKVASGNVDGVVRYWDLQSNADNIMLSQHRGSVLAMAFDKDGRKLATGSADEKVYIWDMNADRRPMVTDTLDFSARPRVLAFNPESSMLAIGFEDGTLRLVSLESDGEQILRGHQRRINSVVFNQKGNLLASGSADNTVRLWNLDRLDTDPIVMSEHQSSIRSAAFTVYGDTLIASTFGRDIALWLTNTASIAGMVQRRAGRNLTLDEWQEFIGSETEYPYRRRR